MAEKKKMTGCKRRGLAINKPRRIRKGEPGYGKKKFVVCAKEGSKHRIIRFGDAKMTIKKAIQPVVVLLELGINATKRNQSLQQVIGRVRNGS